MGRGVGEMKEVNSTSFPRDHLRYQDEGILLSFGGIVLFCEAGGTPLRFTRGIFLPING